MPTQACQARRIIVDGQQAIRLDNGLIQADILPGLGAKVWNLVHLASRTQWIWHNPKLALKTVDSSAPYDDNWAGGWEELFPNDAAGVHQGRMLPDHGEWWNSAWDAEILEDSDLISVRLRLEGRALRAKCEKRVEMKPGQPRLSIHYRIENLESKPIHFLFKQHLAVAVTPGHRIELPGGSVTPVDLGFSTRLGAPGPFLWPMGRDARGADVDLSALPRQEEGHKEFVYVDSLPEGWCGVRAMATGRALRLKFSQEIFPYIWLFMTCGGWRDLYTVVLEPCTNMPKDLAQAVKLGQSACLEPGEALETSVQAILS